MTAKLTLSGLGKQYPGQGPEPARTILQSIDLSVDKGAFVSVVGMNGSGKSTLLRIIAGLDEPSWGEILLDDAPLSDRARRVGMVFQEIALLPWRTALENIEMGLEGKGVSKSERRARAMDYVRAFGLEGFEGKYPKELSGGMRQKAAIARTLIVEPELTLMDEPFSSLDSQTRNALQCFLLDVWAKRKETVIFVTHNVDEAVFLSDAIVVLSRIPTRVLDIVPVDLPRPRDRTSAKANNLRKRVLDLLETETGDCPQVPTSRAPFAAPAR